MDCDFINLADMQFTDSRGRFCALGDVRGRPVIVVASDVAFDDDQADALRPDLRGLGAAFILLTPGQSWLLEPDEPVESLAPNDRGALERLLLQRAPGVLVTVLIFDGGQLRWYFRSQSGPLLMSRPRVVISSLVNELTKALLEVPGAKCLSPCSIPAA